MIRDRDLRRLLYAFLVAVPVFTITCLASWIALRPLAVRRPYLLTHARLLDIQGAVEEHQATFGEYPDSLVELGDTSDLALVDFWERRFQYARTDDAYQLYSLGRDGKPGGEGFDTDIHPDMSPWDMRLPVSQFLLQARGSQAVLWVALIAGVCAGVTSYVSTAPQPDQAVLRPRLFVRLATHSILAIVVAIFLVAYYFIVSNSGH